MSKLQIQSNSFVVKIISFIIITQFFLLLVLIAFTTNTYRVLQENQKTSVRSTLQIYMKQIESKFSAMDKCLNGIMAESSLLWQLGDGNEANRYFASMEIQKNMKVYMLNNQEMDYLVAVGNEYHNLVASAGSRLSYHQKKAINDFLWEHMGEKLSIKPEWEFIELDGQKYIAKKYITEDWTIAAFSRIETFLSDVYSSSYPNGQSFLLVDDNQICLENLKEGQNQYVGDKILQNKGKIIVSIDNGNKNIQLIGLIDQKEIRNNINLFSIFVILAMIVAIACNMAILKYMIREIHQPVNHLIETMEEIEEGDYHQRAEGNYHSYELVNLTKAFNHMIDVIVNVRIKAYNEKIKLLDTEIKYFQMQIKPHFFLNALTMIYSMSYQDRNEDIRSYIDALTKTIRYMFHTGLHTVPLRQEFLHLKNYFNMQEMKYPNCVFWYFDADESVQNWEIPQMLLHTFMENEYKYAVSLDKVLTILIKAEVCRWDQQDMLYIRIEDDGIGFPNEVIHYINYESENPSKEGHHVGLWNIKRTLEVIYQRQNLLYLSNLETGGCLIEIHIPKETKIIPH